MTKILLFFMSFVLFYGMNNNSGAKIITNPSEIKNLIIRPQQINNAKENTLKSAIKEKKAKQENLLGFHMFAKGQGENITLTNQSSRGFTVSEVFSQDVNFDEICPGDKIDYQKLSELFKDKKDNYTNSSLYRVMHFTYEDSQYFVINYNGSNIANKNKKIHNNAKNVIMKMMFDKIIVKVKNDHYLKTNKITLNNKNSLNSVWTIKKPELTKNFIAVIDGIPYFQKIERSFFTNPPFIIPATVLTMAAIVTGILFGSGALKTKEIVTDGEIVTVVYFDTEVIDTLNEEPLNQTKQLQDENDELRADNAALNELLVSFCASTCGMASYDECPVQYCAHCPGYDDPCDYTDPQCPSPDPGGGRLLITATKHSILESFKEKTSSFVSFMKRKIYMSSLDSTNASESSFDTTKTDDTQQPKSKKNSKKKNNKKKNSKKRKQY